MASATRVTGFILGRFRALEPCHSLGSDVLKQRLTGERDCENNISWASPGPPHPLASMPTDQSVFHVQTVVLNAAPNGSNPRVRMPILIIGHQCKWPAIESVCYQPESPKSPAGWPPRSVPK